MTHASPTSSISQGIRKRTTDETESKDQERKKSILIYEIENMQYR